MSHYTRLPAPLAEGTERPTTGHTADYDDYELRSIRRHDEERYEPLTSQPTAQSMSSSLAQDRSFASYLGDAQRPRTPVSSITEPTPKSAVASAVSLTHHHDQGFRKASSAKPSFVSRSVIIAWVSELIAVVVSVGALTAIVALLRREDGKALSEWSLAVSLNTVIATLGTLARTTLAFALSACIGQQKWNWLLLRSDQLIAWARFDEASRGPWGATRLFVWLRARHWAALGALVIIGTVAFDPFLQAILSTEGQLDNDLLAIHEARLPQALLLDAGTALEVLTTGGVYHINTSVGLIDIWGGISPQPDFGVISAIYNGFHNNTPRNPDASWSGDDQVVNSVCTTGNCTWPPFTSAAVCSSCNDVSEYLQLDKRIGTGGGNIPLPSNQVLVTPYTAFTLRNANLSNYDSRMYNSSVRRSSIGNDATLLTANTTYDALETTSFQNLETMLFSFVVLKASNEWLEGNITWNVSRPTATECALYLCANMYEAETRDGKLRETVLRSWAIRNAASYKPDPKSTIYNYTSDGPAIDIYVAQKGDRLYDSEVPRTNLVLSVPKEESPDVMSFTRTLNVSYAFITTTTESFLDLTAESKATGHKTIGMMAYPAWDGGITPLVNALWDSKNLTETFDNVARSLTNQMRNTAMNLPEYSEAPGFTLKWVIHVRVKWAYLAFPAAMIGLGVIYVLLAIWESTRLHVPVWKESAMPSLLHGLDNETQNLLRGAQTDSTGAKAETMRVRFRHDEKDDCLRLIADEGTVH